MLQHLVAKHIPLRKDNKLLRDAAKSSATPSSSKDVAPSHEAERFIRLESRNSGDATKGSKELCQFLMVLCFCLDK